MCFLIFRVLRWLHSSSLPYFCSIRQYNNCSYFSIQYKNLSNLFQHCLFLCIITLQQKLQIVCCRPSRRRERFLHRDLVERTIVAVVGERARTEWVRVIHHGNGRTKKPTRSAGFFAANKLACNVISWKVNS